MGISWLGSRVEEPELSVDPTNLPQLVPVFVRSHVPTVLHWMSLKCHWNVFNLNFKSSTTRDRYSVTIIDNLKYVGTSPNILNKNSIQFLWELQWSWCAFQVSQIPLKFRRNFDIERKIIFSIYKILCWLSWKDWCLSVAQSNLFSFFQSSTKWKTFSLIVDKFSGMSCYQVLKHVLACHVCQLGPV